VFFCSAVHRLLLDIGVKRSLSVFKLLIAVEFTGLKFGRFFVNVLHYQNVFKQLFSCGTSSRESTVESSHSVNSPVKTRLGNGISFHLFPN